MKPAVSSATDTPSHDQAYRALLRMMPDLVFRMSAQGDFLEVLTPDHPDLLGAAGDIVGSNKSQWLSREHCEAWDQAASEALKTGEIFTYTYTLDVSGQQRWFEARMQAVGAHELLTTVRNLTALREAHEQKLRRSKMEALGEIAQQIAHHINTPTATIMLALKELERLKATLSEDNQLSLEKIEDAAHHIKTVIEKVLLVSRDTSTQWNESVPLREIVEHSLERLRDPFPEVDVLWEAPEQELTVEGNRKMIQQVLYHVLKNSCEAALELEDPAIRIELQALEKGVLLNFEDSGMGLSAQVPDHIFEPFFSTKPAREGAGLGLTVCRMIVEEHQGTIEADDDSPYLGGTTISIYLPYRRMRTDFGVTTWKIPGLDEALTNTE